MTRRRIVILIPLMLIGAIVLALFLWPPPARPVVIAVSAPSGTRITGTYEVDGIVSAIDTTAPTEFKCFGKDVHYTIRKDSQPGEMMVLLTAEGTGAQASAGAGPGGRVSGGFHTAGRGITRSETAWATNAEDAR
jgi:hypothetical protein